MENKILSWRATAPEAIAIIDGVRSISYGELIDSAKTFARFLQERGFKQGDPVGIMFDIDHRQIIAQLAILFAGGTCVPISSTAPFHRTASMLNDANVQYVIADENSTFSSESITLLHLSDGSASGSSNGATDSGSPWNEFRRTHILFTSGSTGKPKGVQISSSAIMHLATSTPMTPLNLTDRVAAFNDPGFDLSLFEVWVTLLSGATIVIIPKVIVVDSTALKSYLERQKISIMIMPAALFHIVATSSPDSFHCLRHLLTAGDVANKTAMRAVLEHNPPQHLWNTYGPTECTTLATMREVDMKETLRDRVGIGHSVGQMKIVLMDQSQQVIRDTKQRGEICIAGPQQTEGYLSQQTRDESLFIELNTPAANGVDGDMLKGRGDSHIRFYRTGDMAEWREDGGGLDFFGRKDNQLKHGGFRVELEEIERSLLESELVQSVVVVNQPATDSGGVAVLIAFVVPYDKTTTKSQDLISFARRLLPHYMVPDRFEIVDNLVLDSRGKVDRRAFLESSSKARPTIPSSILTEGNHTVSPTKATLKGMWEHILGVSPIRDDDDFMALGATSLQNAALIARIKKQLGRLISMHDLYCHSRFSSLLHFLKSDTQSITAPNDADKWIKDVNTVDDVEETLNWEDQDEGKIFLTGVTGFVGAFLLDELLRHPNVKQVACLVRGQTVAEAARRLQANMQKYNLWPDDFALTTKIMVLPGDITSQDLGLGSTKFEWLANWSSAIFHLAAKINFCDSYHEHYNTNILGTRNMLRLAARGRRKTFHYVSSIDTWGQTGYFLGTKRVLEDEPLGPHIQGVRYDVGYSQSQWTAEGMVRRMRDRGFPIIIYRPGFIIGHSVTGASNPNDLVSRLISSCIKLGAWLKLDLDPAYVTVDYVVKAMLHISRSTKNIGKSYCLLAPQFKESVSVNKTCSLICQAGYRVELTSYPDWIAQLSEKMLPDDPLAPVMPLLEEKVLGNFTRLEVSQHSPIYDSINAIEALAGSGIQYVLLSPDIIKRYIAFWNKKGFYSI
ncbi:putative NRPS-like enzyme [Fusarium redolens]|uniref:NRPS-like enzyme n=1 Tax=Fusarium redolens TaxID=48865 RepID=A0A9P9KF99_FUSRE|nr:putative NRPS-like enzyme [Fusarium redolens]KAH7255075.1 putative NRPS-like enzyme [Fusarium redolens]